MFAIDDTIVALATAPGRAGLGIVRLSGPGALRIASTLLGRRTSLLPRRATFARVTSPRGPDDQGEVVDQVVATYFPSPKSYTGQDVIELGLHGNPVILTRVIDAATRHGARLAEPGEFTLRAYLHGKVDLVQAEAVHDLVEAVTPRQARAAFDQLDGTVTTAIRDIESRMFDLVVSLEASLDFPEEAYHFVDPDQLDAALRDVADALGRLVTSGRQGRVIREGRRVAIVGRPNVGKSSLFNNLHGSDRAIVTNTPGTTRDLLTETCDVEGVPITFVDTAGIRHSDDEVEREGVARARGAAGAAEAVVVVFDRSVPLEPDDRRVLDETTELPRLLVANKSDLPAAWVPRSATAAAEWVTVSATTGEGVAALRRGLVEMLGVRDSARDEVMVTNVRHLRLLEAASESIARARGGVAAGASEEFVLADVHGAMATLQEVTGRRASDAVLAEIFSKFCIGK
ncbi:MAG: tRNA uridine-5-carboxymethylaminomethyl(34) synthesis GTPase MnmE [Acidobacteria bacterium]|nr:tRNA uridine-5-carboxymethylaminomethyl(34) synthesis GTPase MnmE [Acidobacteriota bacterium]